MRYCTHGHALTKDNTRVTGGTVNGGLYVKCRTCANESARRWCKRNSANNNKHTKKWKYGRDAEAHYETQAKRQKGKCAVCIKRMSKPMRDHAHTCCPGFRSCGRCLRGLLCLSCNFRVSHELEQRFLRLSECSLSKWMQAAFNYVWKWERVRLLELLS
jgi:hypothetical protein